MNTRFLGTEFGGCSKVVSLYTESCLASRVEINEFFSGCEFKRN